MKTIYNEIDPFAAAWLRELIQAEHISRGVVDERSITDLQAADVSGADRVHLFAGIAGWELALALAGWPADRPVWTGSCPCQPFSVAGKGKGTKDARDLWPDMRRLIAGCRPEFVFGEQVPGAIGHGWLDRVRSDLAEEDYQVGAVVLGAHSAGAPHIRQRLYWCAIRLADSSGPRRGFPGAAGSESGRGADELGRLCGDGRLADRSRTERGAERSADTGGTGGGTATLGSGGVCSDRLADSMPTGRRSEEQIGRSSERTADRGDCADVDNERMGDSHEAGFQQHGGGGAMGAQQPTAELRSGDNATTSLDSLPVRMRELLVHDSSDARARLRVSLDRGVDHGSVLNAWSDAYWHPCRDPKRGIVYRRVPTQPGLFPLAHGVPNRVGTLRGAGNAIVPQVAAIFIRSVIKTLEIQ